MIDKETFKEIIPKNCTGPVFIHSDLVQASVFVKPDRDKKITLKKHIEFLDYLFKGRDIWFPAFNYQFPKTKLFNVKISVCEVGALPEYYRKNIAEWRTLDPVFSACGCGENPCYEIPPKEIRAFDEYSIFAQLVEKEGLILFYGSWFAVTFLHYIESLFSPPLYRYDKLFSGTIYTEDNAYNINYLYHVRPKGYHLDYDFEYLLRDLQENGIAKSLKNNYATVIQSVTLKDFWLQRLKENPLYFLDKTSKDWVIPKLEKLGRRFEIKDFE